MGDNIFGKFAGINTRDIDFTLDKNLDKYISSVLSLKEDFDYVYMEDFNLRLYKYIKAKLKLQFKTGRDIRLYNIGMILNEVLKYKKEKHREEILILCKDEDLAYEFINIISYNLKFISIIGIEDDRLGRLYDNIFEETGISIFHPKDIKSTLKGTKIIINLQEKLNKDLIDSIKSIKKSTVVIDFSLNKPLLEIEGLDIITDVVFNMPEDIIFNNTLIKGEIDSILYESLFGQKIKKFSKLCINEMYLKEYKISKDIKLKGTL